MKPVASVALGLRPSKAEAKLINVRVTFQRSPRFYTANTTIHLTDEQFRNPKLKITKEAIEEANDALSIANDVVKELGADFSFAKFHNLYNKRLHGEKRDVTLLAPFAEQYAESKSPKTRSLCSSAVNWVNAFHPNTKFTDITVEFVGDLIGYMKKTSKERSGKEMSENTLRLYLRTLSAVYVEASKSIDGLAKGKSPFRSVKRQSLNSIPRTKSSLKEEELGKIITYVPTNNREEFGKDFFMLSFYLSGINLGDILSLKNNNIQGDTLEFCRRKTRTSGLITTLPLIEDAVAILNKYGCISADAPNEYILPFLSHCQSEKSISSKIHDINKKVNEGLNSICENIGIRHITTYTARHTYSTLVKHTLSTEELQHFLGHTSSRTTQNYLRSISSGTIELNRDFLKSVEKEVTEKEHHQK